MNRTRKVIGWITGICFFLTASGALGQEMHQVNTPFQICCSGDESCARELVQKLRTRIPGLQTEMRTETCLDAAGKTMTYYAVYVWHQNMTAEEISRTLGKKTCPSCGQGPDMCPETTGP